MMIGVEERSGSEVRLIGLEPSLTSSTLMRLLISGCQWVRETKERREGQEELKESLEKANNEGRQEIESNINKYIYIHEIEVRGGEREGEIMRGKQTE